MSITKLSFANGFRIGKEFYLGLEANYLFGTVNRNVSTQNMSDGQFYKIQLENLNSYSDFSFKAGLAYRKSLKNDLFDIANKLHFQKFYEEVSLEEKMNIGDYWWDGGFSFDVSLFKPLKRSVLFN